MAASQGWISPRSSGPGSDMREYVASQWVFGGLPREIGRSGDLQVASVEKHFGLRRRGEGKGRQRRKAGTRNSGTEQAAAVLKLGTRNA